MTDYKTDINNKIFQDAVKSLHLRFPNAEIEKATKYSKGDISNFLNNKKPVSDSFLKTFSEAFNIDLREFGSTKGLKKIPPQSSEGIFETDNSRLILENEFLKQTVKDLLEILRVKQ